MVKWRFRALIVKLPSVFQTMHGSSLRALSRRCLADCRMSRVEVLVLLQTWMEWRLRARRIWTSHGGLQNQPPFSPVANRRRTEARCHENEMPDTLARGDTPSPVRDITRRVQQMSGPSGSLGVTTPRSLATGDGLRAIESPPPKTDSRTEERVSHPSPQVIALGELEFDQIFLIHVYLAGKKLEEVIEDVNYIRYLKSLPMDCFEPEIWSRFGHESLPASDRRKNLDRDPSKTRLYHCIVEKRHDSTVTIFKGPYVDNTRTYLQKIVSDDNVLIVNFADIPGLTNSDDNFGIYCTYYHQVVEDGILLGLRRYRFLICKDGGKEDKQKEEKKKAKNKKCSPSVRCFFVHTESGWDRDYPYILSGCTIDQARRRFMHIHTAPTVSKYLTRFSLILSKTITLDVNFSEVNVIIIEDEPCKDEHGNIVTNDDGEPLIHTDGTGLII
ncbi:hypothetical protein PAHAL_5G510400 [Panicum hallii]|uniref:RNA-dependent RNA polymerase n=2 Tax=Panicum hallii TaxID=206008 RepID=A0A2S3HYN9_9POAL|nr:hypothetical protein PAHAL_5G510400 [Panicum hallii]